MWDRGRCEQVQTALSRRHAGRRCAAMRRNSVLTVAVSCKMPAPTGRCLAIAVPWRARIVPWSSTVAASWTWVTSLAEITPCPSRTGLPGRTQQYDLRGDLVFQLMELYCLRPARVLEVGAANGRRLAAIIERYGCRAVAVEPSQKAIEAGRAKFPKVQF